MTNTWLKRPPELSKPLDRPQVRLPMSAWTDFGLVPPDSYWPQYKAFLQGNPHHALNHPDHRLNRKKTRFYDISGG